LRLEWSEVRRGAPGRIQSETVVRPEGVVHLGIELVIAVGGAGLGEIVVDIAQDVGRRIEGADAPRYRIEARERNLVTRKWSLGQRVGNFDRLAEGVDGCGEVALEHGRGRHDTALGGRRRSAETI